MVPHYKILFADDDEDDRLIFAEAMQKVKPVEIVFVKNGIDLLHCLQTMPEKPDSIFLDLNMVLKNGIATLKDIKSDPAFQHIPVIIYSGSHNSTDIDKAFAAGASLYLVKPCRFDALVELLTRLYGGSSPRYAAVPTPNTFVLMDDTDALLLNEGKS